mmetsp:Transcript_18016/g.51595  ORF Transcript_18016/g.51595 Transcript_18016/m.51595 type:complete len:223 (-) Transcript_18016:61-729(-)
MLGSLQKNCSLAISDRFPHCSFLILARKSSVSSPPTNCSDPLTRYCSLLFENHQTNSQLLAVAGEVWPDASPTLLERRSVIIFMTQDSSPFSAVDPSSLGLGERNPRNTTVRQRGSDVSGSTVAIWTKFPPRIFLERAMEPLILSLQGMTDSSGAELFRPRPLLLSLPLLLPMSPRPAAASVEEAVAMLRDVHLFAELAIKGEMMLLRAAEGRMKPLEDVAR